VTDTRNTRVPRADTAEEWRALGFYHESDMVARVWRFIGTKSGLRTLVRMLASQADKADREGRAAALAVGPYEDFKIRVWERAGIDDESIHGPAADLRRLSQLLESRLASATEGAEFVLGSDYTPNAEYSLVFEVKGEGFDPASVTPALIEQDDLVAHDDATGVIFVPALAFKFHNPDAVISESEGMIRVEGDDLVIEHQTKDAFFGAFKTDVKVATVPVDAIAWVKFKRGLFSAKLSIQARAMKAVEGLPTSKQGRVRLKFARDLRDEAERLAEVLQAMIAGTP
jgi:hypothetical protein